MDLGTIGTTLVAALGAVSFIGAYLGRQGRQDRREKRHLRAVVQAYDQWAYELVRQGFTTRGRQPPPPPRLIEALHDEPDDPPTADADPGPSRPGDRVGSRHAIHE